MKFDYEIDAVTGEILEETSEHIIQEPMPVLAQEAAPTDQLTVEDAKAIALKHAGKNAEEVVFSKAKLEKDDGRWTYEVEFHIAGLTEYEYEIDAVSGVILEAESERWDD